MIADETLVQQIRAGDSHAFDLLYQRHRRALFGYLRRQVAPSVAEDLFQEVFMVVLRDRSFDLSPGRFRPWLFTVARNACLAHARSAQRSARREQAAAPPLDAVAPATTPEAAALAAERSSTLARALAQLSEAQQQLLLLKQVGELTYRELAAVFEVPEGTIKSRVHGAVQALRHALAAPSAADRLEEGI